MGSLLESVASLFSNQTAIPEVEAVFAASRVGALWGPSFICKGAGVLHCQTLSSRRGFLHIGRKRLPRGSHTEPLDPCPTSQPTPTLNPFSPLQGVVTEGIYLERARETIETNAAWVTAHGSKLCTWAAQHAKLKP